MAAAVKEEPETPYSLSLLLSERTPRCRPMTAPALAAPPPPHHHSTTVPPQHHHHTHPQSSPQQLPQPPPQPPPQQPQVQQQGQGQLATQQGQQGKMTGGPFERVPAHSPSTMAPSEASKRHPSPSKPPANDPLSHRIIEKRRRDRMNNCLADLSRLIPTYYLKKGRGRIEKTEIIEMAIKYMKNLQASACNPMENCEVSPKQEWNGSQSDQFQTGYQECMSETMHFLVESEGFFNGDSLCVRLMNHLTKHSEVLKSEGYVIRQSGASSSSSSGYHANSSSTGSSSDGNEESAYRSEDRTGPEEQDDKSSSALDSSSGIGSQLREILQHSGLGNGGDRRGGYSSGLSSSGEDTSRLYKFKSNMKHRFSAEHEQSHVVRKKRRGSESSCGNYTDCEKDRVTPTGQLPLSRLSGHQEGFTHDSNKMMEGGRDSPMLEKAQRGSPSPIPKMDSQGSRSTPHKNAVEGSGATVPIFVLNQNGSYYVPLTIDQSLVSPIMDGLPDTAPVLHPVSIYVNFCGPCPPVTSGGSTGSLQNSSSTLIAQSQYPPGSRQPNPNHISAGLTNFESGTFNGRVHMRPGEKKRRDGVRHMSHFEDQRPGVMSDSVEKRESGEVEMREFQEVREARDLHHHVDHLPRDIPRDLPSRHDGAPEARDGREKEQVHEVCEVRNFRNIRDLQEVREMREIRDPAQTVREYIDANSAYPNNAAYSRTHQHWATAYHIQPKN